MGPGHSPNSPSPSGSSCGCKWASQGFKKKVNTLSLRKLGMFLSVGKTYNYQKIPMKPQRT